MPASVCACRHSYTAHVVGIGKGCSFCNCPEFKDPSEAVVQAQRTKALSEQEMRALDILSHNVAFQAVARDRLVEIAQKGRRRLFLTGALVMQQGDDSDSLHIIVKGRVKVDHEVSPRVIVQLAELATGDIVGEMGVLAGDPRSATVTALEDLETLEVSAKHLKVVFQENPDVLLAVMKVINDRLRTTKDMVETTVRVALAQLSPDK